MATNKNKNKDNEILREIKKIIQLEKEDGLQRFEKREIKKEVTRKLNSKRLKAQSKREKNLDHWFLRKPVFALGMVVVILVIGILWFLSPSIDTRTMDRVELERHIATLPWFQGNIPKDPFKEIQWTDEERLRTELKWMVLEKFCSPETRSISKQEFEQGVIHWLSANLLNNGTPPEDKQNSMVFKIPKTFEELKKLKLELEQKLTQLKKEKRLPSLFYLHWTLKKNYKEV